MHSILAKEGTLFKKEPWRDQVRFKWHIFEHTKEKQIKTQDPDKSLYQQKS